MKTSKVTFIFLLYLQILFIACNKSEPIETSITTPEETIENPDTLSTEAVEVNVQVILPEGSILDLSTTEIVSSGKALDISPSGQATIFINPIEQVFVSLQDKESNGIILMGFINETDRELSIKSTAKASLYFALGAIFQPEEIKDLYFEGYHSQKDTDQFHKDMEALFLADKTFMEKEGFITLVQKTVEELTKPKVELDVTNRILVENGEKSGIRIVNEGLNAISFQSRTRRRTHAFMYKTEVRKEGSEIFVPTEIGTVDFEDIATKENEILTTESFNVLSTIWDAVTGKGLKKFIKDTPPVSLPLEDDEYAAKYQVRVVGFSPNSPKNLTMTSKEIDRYAIIQLETLTFDFTLPFASTLVGFKENIAGISQEDKKILVTAVDAMITSTPSALEPFVDGDFKTAFINLTKSWGTGLINNGVLDPNLKELISFIVRKGKLTIDLDDVGLLKKLFGPIAITDALYQLNDSFLRILGDSLNAKNLESWEVIVSKSKVTLTPRNTIIKAEKDKEYEINIPDQQSLPQGETLEYVITTTGSYGDLYTIDGINSNASLTTNENKFIFKAKGENLQAERNIDSIRVKAYTKDNVGNTALIGEDSTTVIIVEDELKIAPNGATIAGGTDLTLQLVTAEGKPFTGLENVDYKIEWNISANYGLIGGGYTDTEETFNNNKIVYECFDEDVEQGVDYVTAKVYYIGPSTGNEILQQEVEGIINVNNKENVISYTIAGQYWLRDSFPEVGGTRELWRGGFVVGPQMENAVEYKVEIVEYIFNGGVVAQATGEIFTWTNERINNRAFLREDGVYELALSGATVNTLFPTYNEVVNPFKKIGGEAIVTITLQE